MMGPMPKGRKCVNCIGMPFEVDLEKKFRDFVDYECGEGMHGKSAETITTYHEWKAVTY